MREPAYRMRTINVGMGLKARVRVYEHLGFEGHWWAHTDHCTGCTELGDYGSGSENYPVDPRHNCLIGSGCTECGYTGKRRERLFIPFDHEAWAARALAPEAEAQPC